MPAIIGGSSSTGSSLLVNILNRHSELYAGPETHLFTKPKLYQDWNQYKHSIIEKTGNALKSPGIHRFNGLILDNNKSIAELVGQSNSLSQFADNYFDKFGKRDWIEKTPANSYCFDLFLNEVDKGKVILMVRNPYDAVASMNARGLSIFKAASIYLANTLANINLREASNFHIVKYESLINKPQFVIDELCKFLNVSYESEMLKPDNDIVKMEGWKQNEKGELGSKSIGRYTELSDQLKSEIKILLNSIRLTSNDWPFTSVKEQDISDICQLFDYEYLESNENVSPSKLSFWKEELESTIKMYPTNIFNYPISFK